MSVNVSEVAVKTASTSNGYTITVAGGSSDVFEGKLIFYVKAFSIHLYLFLKTINFYVKGKYLVVQYNLLIWSILNFAR